MEQASIFEGVVRGEDSHTNLLRNLMRKDTAYGMAVCDLLSPKGFNLQLKELPDVQTQVTLATPDCTHGRADMLIETRSAVLLVEVKTALYCGLTENQDFGLDDDGKPKVKGYVQYLDYRKQQGLSVGLCLLTPRSWTRRGVIENRLELLPVPAQLKTWQDVCALTNKPHFGEVVREFGAFLENDFMSISFAAEETALLASPAGLAAFGGASLKLHELVKQADKELKVLLGTGKARRFELKGVWDDSRENGADVYRDGKRVLWFGTWANVGWPLVVSFEEKHAIEAQQLDFSGLSPLLKGQPKWRTFKLPKECFTGDEPLRHLVEALVRILRV